MPRGEVTFEGKNCTPGCCGVCPAWDANHFPDENITYEYGVLAGYGGDFVVCWQAMVPRAVPVVHPAR